MSRNAGVRRLVSEGSGVGGAALVVEADDEEDEDGDEDEENEVDDAGFRRGLTRASSNLTSALHGGD